MIIINNDVMTNEEYDNKDFLRQKKEFDLLLDISTRIVSELDIKKVFKLVAEKAKDIVGAETVIVPIINEDRKSYTYKAATGVDSEKILGASFTMHRGMCGWVLANKKPLLFGKDSKHWLKDKTPWEEDQQSAVLVPLFGKKRIIGGLSALGKLGGKSFTEHDLHLLIVFANLVSIAIENAIVFKDWQDNIVRLQEEISERKKQNLFYK